MMRAILGYVIRLLAYTLLFRAAMTIADGQWARFGIDHDVAFATLHAQIARVATGIPYVLALFGLRGIRGVAIFVAFALVGVIFTAPHALAHHALW